MADFIRNPVTKWHDEVPGTRWFRADLHLHTLDDAIGGNISWQAPSGVSSPNDPTDAATRNAYVRCFLKAAIAAGIDVLGLTPHSAHIPGNNGISVVWDIVEAWQADNDDDGTPFREKIYAVFPGFEPSASDGKGGIHLLVIFDPEIGKDRYIKAFTVATGGQDVWREGKHQTSTRDTKALLSDLKALKDREGDDWDYLCIAPHAFSDKGVVESLKGDLGKHFTHGSIAALELKDNHVEQDAIDAHNVFLEDHLKKYCQSLIHCSDAYGLVNGGDRSQVPHVNSPQKRGIGYRYTLVKLASARIESLRQSFLSNDSRLRIVYEKDSAKQLQYRTDIPASMDASRPWLRSVTIEGGTSFFGGKDVKQVLHFSPDLTCIIGGRMTGKSTLLDGIRMYCKMPPPLSSALAKDVKERSDHFLSGNPTITLDITGPIAATLSPSERWPARFFSQRELASIAKDTDNVRKILYHLAPKGSKDLFNKDRIIAELDGRLISCTRTINEAHAVLAEKEQAFETAKKARAALEAFKEAGVEELAVAQADQGRASGFSTRLKGVRENLSAVRLLVNQMESPTLELKDLAPEDIKQQVESLAHKLEEAETVLVNLTHTSTALMQAVDKRADELRAGVQKSLVDHGRMADELNQFDALSKIAANYESSRIAYELAKAVIKKAEDDFVAIEGEREDAVYAHREAVEEIIELVNASIPNVRVSIDKAASRTKLDEWIRELKEAGITRWWNENVHISDPSVLYSALMQNELFKLGMSETVAMRFTETMTNARKYLLRSMRSEDHYIIAARVGSGDKFRLISKLSGGKQISVVLSLLLESSDSSPLVIDQPEDELDKAFLTETLLPILRRLKGKRQVILATHDANIVVNGDADQVIHLESDANVAHVKTQDAIDNPSIRHAVLTVLDGGKEAFDLRKRKYGF